MYSLHCVHVSTLTLTRLSLGLGSDEIECERKKGKKYFTVAESRTHVGVFEIGNVRVKPFSGYR